MIRSRLLLFALGAWFVTGAVTAQEKRILLAHLPSAPVEAANRQAKAVEALAEVLSQQLGGEAFEAKIFRRWRDAEAFLVDRSEDVALLLSDGSLARDRVQGLLPAYRFQHDGRETYRRLLVVRSNRPELEKLVDLRSATLAVVETAGSADGAFLEREVFAGELDPASWFDTVEPVADDFSATASVLYGQTDAALIAEYNPLLSRHLGNDLRAIYESPELSLPVLAVREAAFEGEARAALDRVLVGLGGDPLGQQALAELGIEGLRPLGRDTSLPPTSGRREKAFEIAAPVGSPVVLEAPPLPTAKLLSFAVAVELPDVSLLQEVTEHR